MKCTECAVCFIFYIHVTVHRDRTGSNPLLICLSTVHRNRFLVKYTTRRTDYPNLFSYKILHVSGIFSAHHQEFSTVHSAPVSSMQVFDDRFQAESGWNCLQFHPNSAWKRSSKTCMKLTGAECTVENS